MKGSEPCILTRAARRRLPKRTKQGERWRLEFRMVPEAYQGYVRLYGVLSGMANNNAATLMLCLPAARKKAQ